MWFIGVEEETSAPPPKKNPGSAPDTGYDFCSHLRTVILARFLYRSEAAQRRSLKWRVSYRICVHTIPDRFSCRHEELPGMM